MLLANAIQGLEDPTHRTAVLAVIRRIDFLALGILDRNISALQFIEAQNEVRQLDGFSLVGRAVLVFELFK